jgi:hypothetical protein
MFFSGHFNQSPVSIIPPMPHPPQIIGKVYNIDIDGVFKKIT